MRVDLYALDGVAGIDDEAVLAVGGRVAVAQKGAADKGDLVAANSLASISTVDLYLYMSVSVSESVSETVSF